MPWQILPPPVLPDAVLQAVQNVTGEVNRLTATLLWQRGIYTPEAIAAFLLPDRYSPTPATEFGIEMQRAVERLQIAQTRQEKVLIWGDFDADGLTATAVLWEGFGRIFPQHEQLGYYVPHRFTESHGLSRAGLERAQAEGYQLIVTCDTGCSQIQELAYARSLGLDVIVTDHHTLPPIQPPAIAVINPRCLPAHHPLAHLSGVAVAYKLLEAVYVACDLPASELYALLDLVAIGLIADLVELTGECRYLAQLGLNQLNPKNQTRSHRPGVAALLENCKRSGDRPTDISFGLAPRINAVSRIHGDASFVINLLTYSDVAICKTLADEAELANTRRKGLQQQVLKEVEAHLSRMDLSSQRMIVLYDPQWPIGILGLVAGQIAQDYHCPTLLLTSTQADSEIDALGDRRSLAGETPLARGSARSVNGIDLYQLMESQEHLLAGFGGHPLALGLSLPPDNIPLLREALNRQLKTLAFASQPAPLKGDLTVTVSDLNQGQQPGQVLFRQLKWLEPFGMGNPTPRLYLQDCWFEELWEEKQLSDQRGQKTAYVRTEFKLWDATAIQGFSGIWWGHAKSELPKERCDVLVELDFQPHARATGRRRSQPAEPRYQIRLIAVRPHLQAMPAQALEPELPILDWRNHCADPHHSEKIAVDPPASAPEGSANSTTTAGRHSIDPLPRTPSIGVLTACPSHWDDVLTWHHQAKRKPQPLALAYAEPPVRSPLEVWCKWLGLAKYLSRTQEIVSRDRLLESLEISDRTLTVGLQGLTEAGFQVVYHPESGLPTESQPSAELWSVSSEGLQILPGSLDQALLEKAAIDFIYAVAEEAFRRQYFAQVPMQVLQDVLG